MPARAMYHVLPTLENWSTKNVLRCSSVDREALVPRSRLSKKNVGNSVVYPIVPVLGNGLSVKLVVVPV